MKKLLSVFLAVAIMVSCLNITMITVSSITDYTFGETEDGISYRIDNETGELTVTWADFNTTDLVIPAYIDGKPVTTIGDNFLCDTPNPNLRSVVIPDSVTKIMFNAFANCINLNSVVMSENIEYVEDGAFSGTGITNDSDNWENGALYIGKFLYGVSTDYSGEFVVKDGTKVIGTHCFHSRYDWSGCDGITNIIIPNTVVSIGLFAFRNCKGITSINIPESVRYIGNAAFAFCSNLSEINVNTSKLTYVGQGIADKTAFSSDESNWQDDVLYLDTAALCGKNTITDLRIKEGTEIIADYAFACNDNIVSVDLPNSLRIICDLAFDDLHALPSIELPDSVEYIGKSAFDGCDLLTELDIPYSVGYIGLFAFNRTDQLEKLIIRNSKCIIIDNHEEYAGGAYSINPNTTVYGYEGSTAENFAENNGVKFVSLGQNKHIGTCGNTINYTLYADSGELIIQGTGEMTDYHMTQYTDSGCIISDSPFSNNELVKKVVIKDGVTSIGREAFCTCPNLIEVEIADSVTRIGESAFENANLKSVVLSDNITEIGTSAFRHNTSLTTIKLPNSISELSAGILRDSPLLNNVIVPDNVTKIGSTAFSDCTGLNCIFILNNVVSVEYAAFRSCPNLTIYGYPESYIERYARENEVAFVSIDSKADVCNQIGNHVTIVTDNEKEATCTEDGISKGFHCSYCGEVIVQQSVILATGHQYIKTVTPPTYTEKGYTTYVCKNCSDTYIDDYVDALELPTEEPTYPPTEAPTEEPTYLPTEAPTEEPTYPPTEAPTEEPTYPPTEAPTEEPTYPPTEAPTEQPGEEHICIVAGSSAEIFGTAWHGANEANLMTKAANGTYTKDYTVDKAYTDVQLKTVVDGAKWVGDATGNNVTFTLTGAGTFTVVYDPEENVTYVEGDNIQVSTDFEYETVYAFGNDEGFWLNGAAWNLAFAANKMNEVADDVWEIEFTEVPYGFERQIKFAIDGKWTHNFGGAFEGSSVVSAAEYKGDNITFDTVDVCNIKVQFDLRNFDFASKDGATFTITITYDEKPTYPPTEAPTEEPTTAIFSSGITGECTWTLDYQGTLTISGNGKMGYYYYYDRAPWGTEIEEVIIQDGVTSIGDDAFVGCSSLKSITIPDSVTNIGSGAFKDCISLTSVTIPDGVTSIYEDAFLNCTSLTSITIPDSVTSMCWGVFDNTAWYNNQPNGLTYIGKVAYKYKGKMPEDTSIVIKDGTKVIADTAFSLRSELTSLTIPDSVTNIGNYSFNGCVGLTNIIIPDGVTSVGACAFEECSGLKSIAIPDSVKSIGEDAFYGCPNLTVYGTKDSYAQTYAKKHYYITFVACNLCSKCKSILTNSILIIDAGKVPTCTEVGLSEGAHCAVCNNVITVQEIIPAKGHIEAIDKGYPSTCTETGLTEGSHCSVCGEILKAQEEIPALGHKPVIDPYLAPTCQHEGHTLGSHCENCGEIYVAYDVIPKLPHTVVKDEAVAPACGKTGLTEGSHCFVCGEVIVAQKVVPALTHEYEMVPAVSATYLKDGATEGVRCKHCGEWLIEPQIIPKLPIDFIYGDADGNGRVDVRDVTAIQRHLADINTLTGKQLGAADTNGDGNVTIEDATLLQMFLAEYDVVLG